MFRSSQRGFTMGEVLLVTSLISFVSTGVMTLVSKQAKVNHGEQYYRQMVMDGRSTVDKIAKELQQAGLPQAADNPSLTFANSNKVAAGTFLVANSDQIVFEADLDHNGTVERVEYRLKGENLERSVVTKNDDGSVPPLSYEVVAERVDNGGMPVFTFDGDLAGDKAVSPDPQQVRVMLLLRSPVRDRKSGRARTVGFEAIALRNTTDPRTGPEHIEASVPATAPPEPANVAAAADALPGPSAENLPAAETESDARNSQNSRQVSQHPLLDAPLVAPVSAENPVAPENSDPAASAAQLRAGLRIASTATL